MIVTGFVDLGRYEKRRKSTEEYIAAGSWLLTSHAPLIIFTEFEQLDAIQALRPPDAVTIFRLANYDVPNDSRLEEGIRRSGFRWDPGKDTPRYFWLMRQKIAWLRRGSEIAKAPVAWVDMGLNPKLGPVDPCCLLEGPVDRIRLAELSHVPRAVRNDRRLFYSDHYWPVAGGVIRGGPEDLAWLDACIEKEWQWCLENQFAATDEMMLGYVRFQHPERFEVYYADHPYLVDDWQRVRGSQRLVVEMALRALDDGCPEEAIKRLDAVAAPFRKS